MLSKDRVRTMTRLAIYEEGQGAADDRINGYFENDYIFSHMVGSFVGGTVAFVLIVMLYCGYHYDTLLLQIYENSFGNQIALALTLYAAFMVFFLAVTFFVYHYRYSEMKDRLHRYRRRLDHLSESYKKEDEYDDDDL
ncbi:MAG: hypothetical protein IJG52_00825 [Lachnospiraceae bacterium]|nr:hypothetical protein [Lachnospiraceae bacterium]